ncbi:sialin-like isoform X1 [Schistocerca piceifrons]|uniref:sialin-like isoform X1 n=1 Tax=Schistocerca piceifrons TaxID=274613 RepID=UPI001F5FAF2C|nr:sialin-like isoform X1 [Schistocerca piceifrons]
MALTRGRGCLSCTTVLWYITFLGCGVNYMIRSNINIAIVSMVKKQSSDGSAVVSECYQPDFNITSNYTLNKSLPHVELIDDDDDDQNRFDWDEHEQNVVMGAFFWLYWAAQVPGGMMGQYYGTKIVFGFSNLMISLTTLLIPLFASLDYRALVALRVFQGICGGFCWPSLSYMISRWIPTNERGKFMSAFMGSSLGAALTFPLCGMIIHFFNWQTVFYVTGTIGILWFISWWWLVYDNPAEHPTISESELKRIQNAIGDSVSEKKLPIPWFKILTNYPMIVNNLLQWGCIWGMFTILTQAPTYFRNVHGWSVQKVGFFSGLPHVCRMILAISVGYLCDHLQSSGKLSVTNVRKLAGFIMNIVQGIFTLGLAFCGCNSVMATICLTAALASSGAESSGALATYIDLSPNFASILMGIGNMICVTPGFMSAAVVGALTYKNQSSEQWKKVYLISAGLLLVPGLLHLFKSSAEVQEWNFPKSMVKEMKDSVSEKDVEAQQRLTSEHKTEDQWDKEKKQNHRL